MVTRARCRQIPHHPPDRPRRGSTRWSSDGFPSRRAAADSLAKVLGSAWPPEFSRGLESDDRFHLFVFLVRDQWVPATLPRTVAEVAPELTGRIYGPETAVFRVFRVVRGPGEAVPSLLPR